MSGNTVTTAVTADTPVVTTAETVAVVSDPLSTQYDGDKVTIEGMVSITAGTGTTAVTGRIRRGNTIGGVLVGEAEPYTLAAGASAVIPYQFFDFPGAVAGQQYCLTIQQTAATANGTINNAAVTTTEGS